jgi:hypothetical protein
MTYRAYFFGQMYLSSIQQGIQALHVTAELFVKYRTLHGNYATTMLYDWALNHKTAILLNGGDAYGLLEWKCFLDVPANPFPHAYFEESAGALNKCLTSVGIVLPEYMYDTAATQVGRDVRKSSDSFGTLREYEAGWTKKDWTDWELKFLMRKSMCDLAK